MSHHAIDDRLEQLLDVERRLEERLRAAEADALERVANARAEAAAASEDDRAALELADRDEERADGVAHAARLAQITAEGTRTLEALAGVSEQEIERLARLAVARAVGAERTGGP